jgi:hypothetical protein
MKKLFSLFVMMTLIAGISFAQDAPAATPAAIATESADGPTMEFTATEVDYGTIEQHSDPYRFFSFTNTGNEPLVIQNAKGSCGCTVPTYPKEPILPGESAEIKVRYDTKRIGNFTKTVTLTTNEATPKHVLRIKGKVEAAPEEPEAVPASTGGF